MACSGLFRRRSEARPPVIQPSGGTRTERIDSMGARQLRRWAIPAAVIASLAVYAGVAGASPPTPTGQLGVNQAFVIGNGNAAVGDEVTFWGAQWWKDNVLADAQAPSDVTAPASFKGFANNLNATRRSTPRSRPGRGIAPTRRQRFPGRCASWSRTWSFRRINDHRRRHRRGARQHRPRLRGRSRPPGDRNDRGGSNRDLQRQRSEFLIRWAERRPSGDRTLTSEQPAGSGCSLVPPSDSGEGHSATTKSGYA